MGQVGESKILYYYIMAHAGKLIIDQVSYL